MARQKLRRKTQQNQGFPAFFYFSQIAIAS
nr:MAG TPA: hypothetical protein [Caudoviricetes sp.]